MARPNRTVQVNVALFDYLQNRLSEVMHLITKKQSLNAEDIQALRILCDVYTDTLNLQSVTCVRVPEDCSRVSEDPTQQE